MIKKNLNKTRYLRILTAVVAVLILAVIISPVLRNNISESLSAIYASVLVNLTNQNRALAHVDELKVSPVLEKAAQMKADDMAKRGYFSHNTPEGQTPWYWFALAGYKYKVAGENLAVNFENSEDVETAWMNSPGHFMNIMNPKYTEIGIATSTGTYKGRPAVFVVELFGTPE